MSRTIPFLFLVIVACAPATTPPTSPAPAPTRAEPGTPAWEPPSADNAALRHREIHWFRTSAEYRALAVQVYRDAADAARAMAERRAPGSWAVIMDADETILDNSEYQRRIAEAGLEFDPESWTSWVREEAAVLVPGAAGFIAVVEELGGHVAVVTNRSAEECPPTVRNLDALGVRPAVVLCSTGVSRKEARFRTVEEGGLTGASPGVIVPGAGTGTGARRGTPPLEVVLWVGDNIHDFPDLDQSLREAPAEALEPFGRTWFVLPNPMYGSWARNEWR